MNSSLVALTKKDILPAIETLKDAFKDDPVWNNIFADDPFSDQRLKAFFEIPIRYCSKYGHLYATSKNFEGIAGWVPGKFSTMSIWRMLRCGCFNAAKRMGSDSGKKMAVLGETLGPDRQEHMKGQDYLYLLILGIHTDFHRKGFGSLLLNSLIEQSKQQNIPIYLETEKEENLFFYEKFGFKTLKKVILPEIELPMWEMIRPI